MGIVGDRIILFFIYSYPNMPVRTFQILFLPPRELNFGLVIKISKQRNKLNQRHGQINKRLFGSWVESEVTGSCEFSQ